MFLNIIPEQLKPLDCTKDVAQRYLVQTVVVSFVSGLGPNVRFGFCTRSASQNEGTSTLQMNLLSPSSPAYAADDLLRIICMSENMRTGKEEDGIPDVLAIPKGSRKNANYLRDALKRKLTELLTKISEDIRNFYARYPQPTKIGSKNGILEICLPESHQVRDIVLDFTCNYTLTYEEGETDRTVETTERYLTVPANRR